MTNQHASDCAVHSEPAYPAGPCDCHLSIESRLDEMIKHAYQGSTDAADEIRQELVERYKAMQPVKMQPCAGRNCGSTDPNLHSAECFEDYEKATGMNRQEPVATLWQHGETGRTRVTMPGDITDCDARWFKAADLYTTPPAAPVQEPMPDDLIATYEKGFRDGAAQRQWQSLTDEEITALKRNGERYISSQDFARAIEAKLKEKNNG